MAADPALFRPFPPCPRPPPHPHLRHSPRLLRPPAAGSTTPTASTSSSSASASSGAPAPCTLQLCVGRRYLIFQLALSNSIPSALKQFLEDLEINFAAVKLAYVCRLLREERGLRVGHWVEIRELAARMM